jgi:hypothetical protein
VVALVESIVVDEIGPVYIQQGTEGQSIVPTAAKVSHFNFVVASRLSLTPKEQTLFGRHSLLIDVANGETENQSPYKAENNLAVSVNDIFGSDVGHLDTPGFDEVERQVGILESLYTELGLGGITTERLVGQTLEEVDEEDLWTIC